MRQSFVPCSFQPCVIRGFFSSLAIPMSFPGLSYPVFKGIMKKGYKVPTPIQRKVQGGDAVAG